jgi:hypothetical protein
MFHFNIILQSTPGEHRLRVSKNRELRRIFGLKRDEVTGGWKKLHNEELHGLYSSPSIVRVIKARRMRWAGRGLGFRIDFMYLNIAVLL